MRALLWVLTGGALAQLFFLSACASDIISIGGQDATDDAQQAQDSGSGGDSSTDSPSGSDSWRPDSGLTDAGCVEGGTGYQCGIKVCSTATQYCENLGNGTCVAYPPECVCNHTCACLLSYAKSPCDGGTMKCTAGSTGGIYISCN